MSTSKRTLLIVALATAVLGAAVWFGVLRGRTDGQPQFAATPDARTLEPAQATLPPRDAVGDGSAPRSHVVEAQPEVLRDSGPHRPAAGLDADASFEAGRDLILANAGEALGNSRDDLSAGVRRVEDALARGYADQTSAYRLLASAYNALRSRTDASIAEKEVFLAKERDAYEQLLEVDPARPEWVNAYVATFTAGEEALAALRHVKSKQPRNALVSLALGEVLCSRGANDEGVGELVEASRLLPADDIDVLGARAATAALRCAGDAGLRRVKDVIEHRKKAAAQDGGRPE